MYEVAVFLHILGGFLWIGGLLYVQSFWDRMILSDSEDAARGIYEAINWSANRIIVPAALELLDDEGVRGPRYVAAAHKLIRVARIDSFVVVSILALMVFKPVL